MRPVPFSTSERNGALFRSDTTGGLAAQEACTLQLATSRLGPPRRGRRPGPLSKRLLLARRVLQWDVHVRGHVENGPWYGRLARPMRLTGRSLGLPGVLSVAERSLPRRQLAEA